MWIRTFQFGELQVDPDHRVSVHGDRIRTYVLILAPLAQLWMLHQILPLPALLQPPHTPPTILHLR